jgi:tRNA pseudouridine55 synthase
MRLLAEDSGKIIPIYKPKGMTSFEVVRKVRHGMYRGKVGHAGTLDPLAEGLLIILTGCKTKLMEKFLKFEKEYVATLKLGVKSKSHDLETEPVECAVDVNISSERVVAVLKRFIGRIEQVPPVYSAAWVGGKRAYHLARSGVAFELRPKTVTISKLEIESYNPPFLRLRIICSSGTYVRSLVRDLGEELGCGAVLTELVRMRIGPYKVDDAMRIEEVTKDFVAGIRTNGNRSVNNGESYSLIV